MSRHHVGQLVTVAREAWFDDDELAAYTVPESARPVSVGALQHPMRGGR